MNHQTPLEKILVHLALIVLVIIFILPFFWILQTSIKKDRDIFAVPPKFIPLLVIDGEQVEAAPGAEEDLAAAEMAPSQSEEAGFLETYGFAVTFEHYRRAFTEFPFFLYLWNTVVIVVGSTIGTLFSCSLAAYAFACLRWPDRGALFAIVLATMLLPYQVTLIPVFILFRELGWVNTLLPLIVPAFFGAPFFIFLLRQFFIGLPTDLLEAARIDGAGEFKILYDIVLPLSKPALLTVMIFAAMFAWNDFLGPLIYLSSEEKKTLAVGLQSMVSQHGSEWGLLMAAGSVMIIPILVLFFFAQRYFIEGITLTGMKG